MPASESVIMITQYWNVPLSHAAGDLVCPMDDAAVTAVAFAFAGRDDVDLWVKTSGCLTVANGFITTANDGTVTP